MQRKQKRIISAKEAESFIQFRKYLEHQTDRSKALYDMATYLLSKDTLTDRQLSFKNSFFATFARELAGPCGCSEVVPDHLRINNPSKTQFLIELMLALHSKNLLGDICRRLKNLIMEADVAGIVLAQLNRNCEARTDHVPVMSDLRNSGEIEQIADSIAFVYRPEQYREYYDKQTKEDMRGVGQLFVAKNRNGSTGEIRFRYNKSLTQIYAYK